MVELKLEPLDSSLTKDFYVSVRVGEVQKLSRINAGRGYKFSSSAVGERKFGKIEIFKKVGHASVGIVPETGVDQEVRVNLEDSSEVKFKVTINGDSDKPPASPVRAAEDKPEQRDANPKVQAAKAYLEQHNLEMRLSEAMQAVLREKPEDPAEFVAERLRKSAGMVQKLPKTEEPPPAPEQAKSAPPAQAMSAAPVGAKSAPPVGASVPTAQVLPFAPYYNVNMRSAGTKAFQGVYSLFPPASRAAAPLPAPAVPPPAAPAANKPVEAAAAAAPEAAKAAPPPAAITQGQQLAAPGSNTPQQPISDRWEAKPSVGTWATHLRGPKLPKGAAQAS